MGHHHKKNRPEAATVANPTENVNTNPSGNTDFTSMLSNFNLDNIDLSKIDFNKVQSMMKNIKLPDNVTSGDNTTTTADPRLAFLSSLKGILPPGRAKSMDSVTKFIQIASLIRPTRSQ